MSDVALIFQTEQGQATPRLKPQPGTAPACTDDDLRTLEADLSRQYQDLIRGKVSTVNFQGRALRVTVQNDGRTRMPAVLLSSGTGAPLAPIVSGGEVPPWLEGMLTALERLSAGAPVPGPDNLERTMLRCAADELRGLAAEVGSDCVAGLLLANHLSASEQLARTTDPERATVYALALRGLDKLLAHAGRDETGPGTARAGRAGADGPTPRGSVARLLRRLLCLPVGPTGTSG